MSTMRWIRLDFNPEVINGMSNIEWMPLESNPDVMNKYLRAFGVPENWGFSDVVSLDEEYTETIPTPCLAMLLLCPVRKKPKKEKAELIEMMRLEHDGVAAGVYHMRQTIVNACGTIALIHALANNVGSLNLMPNSVLQRFLDATKYLNPKERGNQLENNGEISKVHQALAQEGQTGVPNIDDDVKNHFIALVNVDGKLVELDGRKPAPVVHGDTTDENFIRDSFRVCRSFMARNPSSNQFCVLSFGAI